MIIENKTNFNNDEIFMIAKRENNTKRSFLVVNNLQAKHVPVSPQKALSLFEQLGKLVAKNLHGKKVIVVGFAETATAIGAAVAKEIGGETTYIHTTRENLDEKYKVIDFSEEHSHATEQRLYCKNATELFKNAEAVVFVEDEITTGKTIINFLNAFYNKNIIDKSVEISVATIISGLQENNLLAENNINLYYLLKIDNTDFEEKASNITNFKSDEDNIISKQYERKYSNIIHFNATLNPRLGININYYYNLCFNISNNLIKDYNFRNKDVLVLGSEEFMYPSLILGSIIEKESSPNLVNVHATTRSPILPSQNTDYPLFSRYKIKSLYDKNRQTYIYNLKKYDIVLVFTDSKITGEGFDDLANCLYTVGNDNIVLIRWVV